MSRLFKNKLNYRNTPDPIEERCNLNKEILKDSTPFPNPVGYKEIDEAFVDWVENKLDVTFEGKNVPTIALFSSQRFSEYMQDWENTDDKKNLILNFKTVTRDNNPQKGTMYGGGMNIPGDKEYLPLGKRLAQEDSGRKYIIEYRMKQPLMIDFNYYVSIVTNRYTMLNEFNRVVNDRFKAIDDYLCVEGHYMSMTLSQISDESEYSIDDRQFFSQSYSILVRGYIITEDDFVEEEKALPKLTCFDGISPKRKGNVSIEELPNPCQPSEKDLCYKAMLLDIDIDTCDRNIEFKMDEDFKIMKVKETNLRRYKLYINDKETEFTVGLLIKNCDTVKILKINTVNPTKSAKISIEGYNPYDVYDANEEYPESELDDKNNENEEIIVS